MFRERKKAATRTIPQGVRVLLVLGVLAVVAVVVARNHPFLRVLGSDRSAGPRVGALLRGV